MYEDIDEQVEVNASFTMGDNKIKPFVLVWKGKRYKIEHLNYSGKHKSGQSIIYDLHVDDGTNYFELQFDALNAKWLLGRVSDNEAH